MTSCTITSRAFDLGSKSHSTQINQIQHASHAPYAKKSIQVFLNPFSIDETQDFLTFTLNHTHLPYSRFTWRTPQVSGEFSLQIEGERLLLENMHFKEDETIPFQEIDQRISAVYRANLNYQQIYTHDDVTKLQESSETSLLALFWNSDWTQFSLDNQPKSYSNTHSVIYTKVDDQGNPINPLDLIPVPEKAGGIKQTEYSPSEQKQEKSSPPPTPTPTLRQKFVLPPKPPSKSNPTTPTEQSRKPASKPPSSRTYKSYPPPQQQKKKEPAAAKPTTPPTEPKNKPSWK